MGGVPGWARTEGSGLGAARYRAYWRSAGRPPKWVVVVARQVWTCPVEKVVLVEGELPANRTRKAITGDLSLARADSKMWPFQDQTQVSCSGLRCAQ